MPSRKTAPKKKKSPPAAKGRSGDTRRGDTRRPLERIFAIHEAIQRGRFPNCRQLAEKIEVTQKQLRGLKLVLCHDYCQDLLARLYCDATRLQILYETDRLRRR